MIPTTPSATGTSSPPTSGRKKSPIDVKVEEFSNRWRNLCKEDARLRNNHAEGRFIDPQAFYRKVRRFSKDESEFLKANPNYKVQYEDLARNKANLALASLNTSQKVSKHQRRAFCRAAPTSKPREKNERTKPTGNCSTRNRQPHQNPRGLNGTELAPIIPRARPIISNEIMNHARDRLKVATDNTRAFIQRCFENPATTLTEQAAQLKEINVLLEEFAAAKRDVAKSYVEGKIDLIPSDFTWDANGTGKGTQDTILSILFKDAMAPLNNLQTEINQNLVANIAATHHQQDNGGIGDCLFRSIEGVDPKAGPLRRRMEIVEYLRNNRNPEYEGLIADRLRADPMARQGVQESPGGDPFNRYLTWMMKENSWGGDLEIIAYCNMQKRPVVVICEANGHQGVNTFNPIEASNLPPIVIKNTGNAGSTGGGTHFVSMVPN